MTIVVPPQLLRDGVDQPFANRDATAAWYEHTHANEPNPARVLGFPDAADQAIRLQALLQPLDLHGKTLLDVGCGHGDLTRYLPDDCQYLGIDVTASAIRTAQASYPTREFRLTDELEPADILVAADVISCTHFPPGVFVQMLHEHAREVVALSMWGPYAGTPDRVLSWMPKNPGRVEIRTDHHPNNVAVWIWK